MPARVVAAEELAKLIGVLSHAHRIRIVEELQHGELDVNTLSERLEVNHSRVSQQLGLLRSHRLVTERRQGRHVFYRLTQPKLALWLMAGLEFLESEFALGAERKNIIDEARNLWKGESDD